MQAGIAARTKKQDEPLVVGHSTAAETRYAKTGFLQRTENYEARVGANVDFAVYFHELGEVGDGWEKVASSGLVTGIELLQSDGIEGLQLGEVGGALHLPVDSVAGSIGRDDPGTPGAGYLGLGRWGGRKQASVKFPRFDGRGLAESIDNSIPVGEGLLPATL